MCNRVKEILRETNHMGINATLIVTRADTVADPYIRQGDIALKFSLPPYRINMVSNYTRESEKDFKIDKRTLWILSEAVQRAQNYFEFHCNQRLGTYSPTHPTFTPASSSSSPVSIWDQMFPRPSASNSLPSTTSPNPISTSPSASNSRISTTSPISTSPPPYQQPTSQPGRLIAKIILCPNGSRAEAKGQIKNVDGSSSVADFRSRIVAELGDTYSQVIFPGSQSDSQAISSLLSNDGILNIAFPTPNVPTSKEIKLVVVRGSARVGVLLRADLSAKLADIRTRIVNELGVSSFSFCDDGIPIFSAQENIYPLGDIVKEGQVFIQ